MLELPCQPADWNTCDYFIIHDETIHRGFCDRQAKPEGGRGKSRCSTYPIVKISCCGIRPDPSEHLTEGVLGVNTVADTTTSDLQNAPELEKE